MKHFCCLQVRRLLVVVAGLNVGLLVTEVQADSCPDFRVQQQYQEHCYVDEFECKEGEIPPASDPMYDDDLLELDYEGNFTECCQQAKAGNSNCSQKARGAQTHAIKLWKDQCRILCAAVRNCKFAENDPHRTLWCMADDRDSDGEVDSIDWECKIDDICVCVGKGNPATT